MAAEMLHIKQWNQSSKQTKYGENFLKVSYLISGLKPIETFKISTASFHKFWRWIEKTEIIVFKQPIKSWVSAGFSQCLKICYSTSTEGE